MGKHHTYLCILFGNNSVLSQHVVVGRKTLDHALQQCTPDIVYHIKHMQDGQSYTFDWVDRKVIVHHMLWDNSDGYLYSILYYNKKHKDYGPEFITFARSVLGALMHVRHDRYVLLQNVDDVETPICDSHIVYVLHKHDLTMDDNWVLL